MHSQAYCKSHKNDVRATFFFFFFCFLFFFFSFFVDRSATSFLIVDFDP